MRRGRAAAGVPLPAGPGLRGRRRCPSAHANPRNAVYESGAYRRAACHSGGRRNCPVGAPAHCAARNGGPVRNRPSVNAIARCPGGDGNAVAQHGIRRLRPRPDG